MVGRSRDGASVAVGIFGPPEPKRLCDAEFTPDRRVPCISEKRNLLILCLNVLLCRRES